MSVATKSKPNIDSSPTSSLTWPSDFEKTPRLDLSTIGRKTGKIHSVTINFVTLGSRIFVVSSGKNRDWVKNVLKNPKVKVTINNVTKDMKVVPVIAEEDRTKIEAFYKKKFRIGARLYYNWSDGTRTKIFELMKE